MLRKQLQLGLIHVAVAMTLVPINSTLNRVMIKELAISATLVALLASFPYIFSPIQVAIGSFSDRHPILGFRRTPYIFLGLLLCVSGLLLSPQVAFTLAHNFGLGVLLGLLAFGAWGMGFNLATVSYLSLATELSGEKSRGRTIAIMWFMMITSLILTAVTLSHLLGEVYDPQVLIKAFEWVGLVALGLGLLGLLGLESRTAPRQEDTEKGYTLGEMIRPILNNRQATLFFLYLLILLAAILGQDILLEPFGGEAFGMTVQQTTRITSIWGSCVLIALLLAGLLEKRVGKRRVAQTGAVLALIGFLMIAASPLQNSLGAFYSGILLLGSGTGLSTVSNLSLMLDMTASGKVGLFMGAWGMSNAFSRLIGSLLAGAIRDILTQLFTSALIGYMAVFVIEALMLLTSLWLLSQIDVNAFLSKVVQPGLIERAAAANDL
jgi:BCD family chlorophyll transporter-like MFS transporter